MRTIHNTHADLIRANVLRVRNYYSTVNLVVLSKLINYTDKQALKLQPPKREQMVKQMDDYRAGEREGKEALRAR